MKYPNGSISSTNWNVATTVWWWLHSKFVKLCEVVFQIPKHRWWILFHMQNLSMQSSRCLSSKALDDNTRSD